MMISSPHYGPEALLVVAVVVFVAVLYFVAAVVFVRLLQCHHSPGIALFRRGNWDVAGVLKVVVHRRRRVVLLREEVGRRADLNLESASTRVYTYPLTLR